MFEEVENVREENICFGVDILRLFKFLQILFLQFQDVSILLVCP